MYQDLESNKIDNYLDHNPHRFSEITVVFKNDLNYRLLNKITYLVRRKNRKLRYFLSKNIYQNTQNFLENYKKL